MLRTLTKKRGWIGVSIIILLLPNEEKMSLKLLSVLNNRAFVKNYAELLIVHESECEEI